MVIKVGINGYGTIGKRVAYAVSKQDDMKVVGVTKTRPDFEARLAVEKGFDLYVAIEDRLKEFEERGIEVKGTLSDLLEKVDVIVDATPGGFGEKYKKSHYLPKGVNAIFEGGEDASVADVSFVAQCNYERALGAKYIRVVSCNTTALCRSLHALDTTIGLGKVRANLVRRAADPHEDKKGPINAIKPTMDFPSHHAPDVKTVLPHLDIITSAVVVPTTIMHLHVVMAELKNSASREDVVQAFEDATRIMLVSSEDGFSSTSKIIEMARDLERPRYDLYELCIWEDSIHVLDGREVFYVMAVHQEAIVVPENVDAIRAMFKLADKEESIRKTNRSLGIRK